MLDAPPFTFTVTNLKDYTYCPRILYYQTVLPQIRPTTYKMEAGKQAHQQTEENEKRRQLRTYGITHGTRHFNVQLYSPPIRLSGELDLLIETPTELIPVDYKDSDQAADQYRLQLIAYARLLQELIKEQKIPHKPILRGFLYLIPTRKAVEIKFTPNLWQEIEKTVQTMTNIADKQQMPPPTPQVKKCTDCEFRRFCNDIF